MADKLVQIVNLFFIKLIKSLIPSDFVIMVSMTFSVGLEKNPI